MGNKFLHKILVVALVLMSASLSVQAEELCMDGTLLFREDFGGNDPDDPKISTTAVPGMSYTQATTDALGSMGGGKYLVTKQGYCNGNGTSQWHLQDDHTHFGDLTRGYLLEIDGRGDNAAFYSTTIDGLCEGSHLTFSAYVANVMTWGMYIGRPGTYAYPRLKFVLTDPVTDAELATYDTGDIPFDSAFIGDNMCWQQSVEWRLVGMNFTVPAGQNSVKLTIYNNAIGSNGNDFAIDDIEIRLCAPPVTIEGEAEVCMNETATLTANFENDGTFAEPLGYKWFFTADSVSWETLDETSNVLNISNVQKADSGWYKVAVSGIDNIESLNCRAMSEPFRLRVNECEPPESPVEELCMDGILLFREDFGGNDPSDPRVGTNPVPGMSYTQATNDVFRSMGSGKYIVTKSGYCNGDTTGWSLPGADQSTYRSQWYIQDDHTYPNDYSRGYFMEIDGSGGNQQFYQTEISGLCEGIELTFSAYVANVFTWFQYDWYTRNRGPVIAPCLKFVLTNPQTGETLAEKNTQQIPFAEDLAAKTDWQYSSPWYLVGMNFIVPTGIPAIRLTIYNNVTNGNGNDFALDDIEVRLCLPPVTIEGESEICLNTEASLTADFTNDGTLIEPLEYKWWHSDDSLTWTELPGTASTLTLSSMQEADTGWYRVAVSGAGNIGNVNCRALSTPFRLTAKECTPPKPELCMDGTLLFREDFGGNDPNDPAVSMASVPGMSSQYHNSGNSLGSGNYSLRKEGWHNGIQWHWQDDHTYPGDKTRGYLLEVDGVGGAQPFYSKTIDGLCTGSLLTFSAYVVNVHYAGQLDYFGSSYVFPRLKFVLKDPMTGSILAEKSTGDIQPDWRYGTPETWKYARDNQLSAEWQLVGLNFTVPEGVQSIQMYIYNDVERNGSGNDFAIDDIEIHLCLPPLTIEGEKEVCLHSGTDLTAEFTNDGTLIEPLEYKWWHSDDSLTWTELPGSASTLTLTSVQEADSGWYKAAVSGAGNIGDVNCRALSDPFRLHVETCQMPEPELCMDGTLLYLQKEVGNYSMYTKTLSGFCAGSKLSFYALVSYNQYASVIQAAVIDPNTHEELALYERYLYTESEEAETVWYNGKQWLRIGVNYTVPEGMSDIGFYIGNDYNASIDSFAVRLCVPPVTIIALDTVCIDTKNTLVADFENDGSLVEPVEYQWYFSSDSLTWTPVTEGHDRELKFKAKPRHTGWYKVAVAGSGNIHNEKCCAMSEPHKIFVIEDCPPILCPEGILLLQKEFDRNVTFIDTTITDLCSDLDLSFIINLPPDHADVRLMLRLLDASTGSELSAYDTGDVPPDSLQVGTNFMIPRGVSGLRWIISNNGAGATGQPFAIDNMEIRLCLEPIFVTGTSPACRKQPHSLQAVYENYDIIKTPEYQWYYSPDSAGLYSEIDGATEPTYTIHEVHKSDEGWYRVGVSEQGNMAYMNCRSLSEPFHLQTRYCYTAVSQFVDTLACDTLLEYDLTWRGHRWPAVGTVIDTIKDFEDDDSLYLHLTLSTKECCPSILTSRHDTVVCDTLLPFTWLIDGHAFVFNKPQTQALAIPHERWENCTGLMYSVTLDTVHCEKLWPLIVNKYNWQLLLDNVTLQKLFPNRTALAYQWYKNDLPIAGATDDDYSEQNELQGRFQLQLELDGNQTIWSNILEINIQQTEQLPVHVSIYNSHGVPVQEEQVMHGVYLYRYEQGDKVWTEKKLIP